MQINLSPAALPLAALILVNIMTKSPFISIIIPVHNGGSQFLRCLAAIRQSTFLDWELLVIDDASGDGSGMLARHLGANVFSSGGQFGPAAARNMGAGLARGEILFFTDADCEVHADTLARIARIFQANPRLAALFGSYDDAPAAPNFMARYKNLFHHYVHQRGKVDASTFWAGCGAVKRAEFLALDGFDTQRYHRPAIEDIDFGYRLKQAGGQILLAKAVQVKHLKAWTFLSLLKSDIFDRGIPWTRLLLRNRVFARDLNLQTHNRVSVVTVYGVLLALALSFWQPQVLFVALALACLLLWLNIDLYHFFYRAQGLIFTLRVIPMHWFYYVYNAVAFGCGLLLHWRARLKPKSAASLVDGVESEH